MLCLSFLADRAALAQAPDHLRSTDARRVDAGPPLTLAGAIDEALTRNPTLLVLRQQFEAARHRPAQARALAAPTFEAQIWQWPVDTINPLNTNMYMFTVQQELGRGAKRDLAAAVAEKDVELTSIEITLRARDVIKEVTRAYTDLSLARRAIDIHLESVALLRQFADLSSVKYAAGRTSQQDVLGAVVELSKLHDELVMHEEGEASAAARLNTLLDRDPHAAIGPLAEPREEIGLPSSEELQRLAIDHQPELVAAKLQVERAKAALAAVNGEYKPDFFVVGGYMLTPRQAGAWTASVGMTWPNAPWSRGRLDARKAEAAADAETAALRVRATERSIQLAVHDAYVRTAAAGRRALLLQSTIVPQSVQTLEVSRVAYQADRSDLRALIGNQRTLLDARLSYYRALGERELAFADLERAVGAPIPPTHAHVTEAK
jgi:cobalt-zinc-cadmium efflux system outer membrane protein